MEETLYIFEEAVEKGWLKDTVRVVRKDGRLFDYVLDGEEVRPHEKVTVENLDSIMQELRRHSRKNGVFES
ncbi:hypothetical protein [Streptococcus hyovaginalis]|uniref:competence regulator inhibitor paratox n=1 Tax=Streptococcus hyovaginalis TaxID=149015 RepID=UPI003BF8F356